MDQSSNSDPAIPDVRRWVNVETSDEQRDQFGNVENQEEQYDFEGYTHWVYLPDYLPDVLDDPSLAEDLSWVIDELLKHPEIERAIHYDRELLAVTSSLSKQELRSLVAAALRPHISPNWTSGDRRPFDLDLDNQDVDNWDVDE